MTKMNVNILLEYISYFQDRNSVFGKLIPRKRNEDGTFSPSHPQYAPKLIEFIKAVQESGIMRADYLEIMNRIEGYRNNELNFIKSANLETVSAIMTGYVRGERFNDGMWYRCCEKKIFLALLERIRVIYPTK